MHPSPDRLPRGPKRDLTAWWARYNRILKIAKRLGRSPHLSDGVDPSDVGWPAKQRRATSLMPGQRAALRALPGWSDDPRQDAWEERAGELRVFLQRHQRQPKVGGHVRGESALAHWRSRQRVAELEGRFSPERARVMRYVDPEFKNNGSSERRSSGY